MKLIFHEQYVNKTFELQLSESIRKSTVAAMCQISGTLSPHDDQACDLRTILVKFLVWSDGGYISRAKNRGTQRAN